MKYQFRGTQYDQGALAQAFASTVGAAQQSAGLKAGAYADLADTLIEAAAGIVNRKQARDENALDRALRQKELGETRDFQRTEAERDRAMQESRFVRAMAEESERRREENRLRSELALFNAKAQLSEGAIGQGYPAPGVIEVLDDQFRNNPTLSPGSQPVGPLGPGASPPGGPGGFLIGQQETDPLYQKLQLEGRAPQGGGRKFTDLQPLPKPMTWEEQKYRLDDEQKRKVAATTLELARLRAQGSKDVEVEWETSLADALGFGDLDEFELEEAVKKAYPELAPAITIDGKEGDRRALDAKLKLLTKKQKIRVPNGPGITSLEWSGAGGDPTVIVGALSEAFGQDFAADPDALPMTSEQADAYAAKQLLGRYPEYVNRFRPANVQLQGELGKVLGEAADSSTLSKLTGGELQPFAWTDETVRAAGLEMSRLPRELQEAARFKAKVGPDASGRLVFLPMQDGTRVPQKWQDELDKLMESEPGRVEATSAAGAENVTPSDMKKGAAGRALKGKPAAAPAQGEAQVAPPSAMERYRQLREGGGSKKPAPTPAPQRPRIPRQIGLIGVDEELDRLLMGAGGPR